jgi:hypothetical protein
MYLEIEICDAFDVRERKAFAVAEVACPKLTGGAAVEGITPRVDKAP